MTVFQVPLDISDALRAPTTCWRCGADGLTITVAHDRTSWYCPSCSSCWDTALGAVSKVAPSTCRGCAPESPCSGEATRPVEGDPCG